MPDLSSLLRATQFKGKLFPQQTSQAMDAARRTANELLKTAEVLFEHERFAHCVSTSILAMEEAGKLPIIQGIFLGLTDLGSGWRDYSRHLAKTAFINTAISLQIRAHLPQVSQDYADFIGKLGPDPENLEKTKQRAIYSDCLDMKGKCEVHEPSTVEWKAIANYVLCDARVLVGALRHYSATELSIWLKHAKLCQKEGRTFETCLSALEAELRDAGFNQPGWWKNILGQDSVEAVGSPK